MYYRSETHRCSFDELDERLRTRIRALASERSLPDVSSVLCTRTHSAWAQKPNFFLRTLGLAGAESMESALLVGSTHVIVANTGKGGASAMAAPLATFGVDVQLLELTEDGFAVLGQWGRELGGYLIRLGPPDRTLVEETLRRIAATPRV